VTPPELRDLVADSLALWGVAVRVSATEDGVALTAPDGAPLRIRPAAVTERPLRWWLERPGQRRPCTSVLGLLRGLRNAVGAGESEARRLRVALPEA
jgi:hypothetical protein